MGQKKWVGGQGGCWGAGAVLKSSIQEDRTTRAKREFRTNRKSLQEGRGSILKN